MARVHERLDHSAEITPNCSMRRGSMSNSTDFALGIAFERLMEGELPAISKPHDLR